MYIPEFWCGVILTILIELVLVIGVSLVNYYTGGKNDEEDDFKN